MKKVSMRVAAVLSTLMPAIALAQFGEINTFFGKITSFINDILIPLVFAIALLMFIWGIFQYFILGGADEDKRKDGRQLMLYSVAGFVLMVSIFGIVNLIAGGLDLDKQDISNIPNAPKTNR